jgi:hypothetical protein
MNIIKSFGKLGVDQKSTYYRGSIIKKKKKKKKEEKTSLKPH